LLLNLGSKDSGIKSNVKTDQWGVATLPGRRWQPKSSRQELR